MFWLVAIQGACVSISCVLTVLVVYVVIKTLLPSNIKEVCSMEFKNKLMFVLVNEILNAVGAIAIEMTVQAKALQRLIKNFWEEYTSVSV